LWFGAPHWEFTVLDDIQTAGLYLCGMPDLSLCQVACKLAPALPIVRASLFDGLAHAGRWSDAQTQLAAMKRLDPKGPLTYAAMAKVAAHAGKAEQAIAMLHNATEIAPQTWQFHFSLGSTYAEQGKWPEAKKCYQNALGYAIYERTVEAATHGIAFMGALEAQAKGDWDSALTNYDRALELRPDHAE